MSGQVSINQMDAQLIEFLNTNFKVWTKTDNSGQKRFWGQYRGKFINNNLKGYTEGKLLNRAMLKYLGDYGSYIEGKWVWAEGINTKTLSQWRIDQYAMKQQEALEQPIPATTDSVSKEEFDLLKEQVRRNQDMLEQILNILQKPVNPAVSQKPASTQQSLKDYINLLVTQNPLRCKKPRRDLRAVFEPLCSALCSPLADKQMLRMQVQNRTFPFGIGHLESYSYKDIEVIARKIISLFKTEKDTAAQNYFGIDEDIRALEEQCYMNSEDMDAPPDPQGPQVEIKIECPKKSEDVPLAAEGIRQPNNKAMDKQQHMLLHNLEEMKHRGETLMPEQERDRQRLRKIHLKVYGHLLCNAGYCWTMTDKEYKKEKKERQAEEKAIREKEKLQDMEDEEEDHHELFDLVKNL